MACCSRPWFAAFSTEKRVLLSELKERQFNEAESRRQESFAEAGFEQQQQFFDEDHTQWEGENVRVTEFEELMAMLGDAFLRNEKSREVALQNWNAGMEDTYERSEASRNAIFKSTEDRRESLFQKDLKRSEWYNNVRSQYIQRGHHAREQACQQLEREMIDQFESISRFFNDALAACDHRYASDPVVEISASQPFTPGEINKPSDDPCVKNNTDVRNGVVSVVNHDDPAPLDRHYTSGVNKDSPTTKSGPNEAAGPADNVFKEHPRHSKRPASVSSLELYQSHFQTTATRLRSESRGRSHTPPSQQPPPVVSLQATHIIPRENRLPIPFHDRADSSRKVTPLLQDPEVPESSLCLGDDIYSARFFKDQYLREQNFSIQENKRTKCFETAETERDRAGDLRTDTFRLAEQQRMQQFEAALVAYEDSLHQREKSRLWRENMRDQMFATSQAHHSCMFDKHLTWIRKKDSAMHTEEGIWTSAAKQRLETLSTLHDTVLEQYRWALTGSQLSERSPSPPPDSKSEISDPGAFILPSPVLLPMPRMITPERPRPPSGSHYHSPSPPQEEVSVSLPQPTLSMAEPRVHSAGFALQALVENISGTHLPLPNSSSHSHNWKIFSVKAGNKWTRTQRRRQFLVEKSQEEQSRRFEHGMRSRHSQFEASENRRQREFKDARQSIKASFAEAERTRDIIFKHFQANLSEIFDRGEEERERIFQNAENEREQSFQRQQTQRDNTLHQSQEDLQRRSFNQENRRASEFNIWWGERMASVKTMVLREKRAYLKERQHDQEITGLNPVKGKDNL